MVPRRFHLSSYGVIRKPDYSDQIPEANKLMQPAVCFKHLCAVRKGVSHRASGITAAF